MDQTALLVSPRHISLARNWCHGLLTRHLIPSEMETVFYSHRTAMVSNKPAESITKCIRRQSPFSTRQTAPFMEINFDFRTRSRCLICSTLTGYRPSHFGAVRLGSTPSAPFRRHLPRRRTDVEPFTGHFGGGSTSGGN